jgi:hypothetical protein
MGDDSVRGSGFGGLGDSSAATPFGVGHHIESWILGRVMVTIREAWNHDAAGVARLGREDRA